MVRAEFAETAELCCTHKITDKSLAAFRTGIEKAYESAGREIFQVAGGKGIDAVVKQRLCQPKVEDAAKRKNVARRGFPNLIHTRTIRRDVHNPPPRVGSESLNHGHRIVR